VGLAPRNCISACTSKPVMGIGQHTAVHYQGHMGSFTFLDHDPLQKGIPVPKKMAFFGSATIASPQILYSLLILLQRYLELLDVFCAPFPKRCLCLAISLFPFFRGSIYLDGFA